MQKSTKNIMNIITQNRALITVAVSVILTAAVLAAMKQVPAGGSSTASPDEYKTVILYGNDDPGDLEILKKRLDLWAGQGKYSLDPGDGFLTLRLPASLVRSDDDLGTCLEIFVTGPCAQSIVCTAPDDDFVFPSYFTVAPLTPEICLSARAETLPSSPGIQEEDGIPTLSMSAPPTRRLVLTLSEDAAGLLGGVLQKGAQLYMNDNNIYDGFETRHNPAYSLVLSPSDEGSSTFCIDYNELSALYGREELLIYNLTHEPLSKPFNYCITDSISWEDPSDPGSFGTRQCAENAIDGSYLFFRASPAGSIPADKRALARLLLLRRLDLLNAPYAIGVSSGNSFCVKIASSGFTRSVPDLLNLQGYGLFLRVPDAAFIIDPGYLRVRYDAASSALMVSVSAETAAQLREAAAAVAAADTASTASGAETASDTADADPGAASGAAGADPGAASGAAAADPGNPVFAYLSLNYKPVARCRLDASSGLNTLIFEDYILPEGSGDHSWLAALLQDEVNTSASSTPALYIDYLYYCEGERKTFNSCAEMPLEDRDLIPLDNITAGVRSILPDAEVEADTTASSLLIHMNLPLDDNFVDRMFTLVPRLLEVSSLGHYFENVEFFPYDPVGDERCLLNFTQYSGGSPSFSGFLYNGRIEAYRDEILEAVRKDTFFNNMIKNEYFNTDGWHIRDF